MRGWALRFHGLGFGVPGSAFRKWVSGRSALEPEPHPFPGPLVQPRSWSCWQLSKPSYEFLFSLFGLTNPHGPLRGFRWPQILGCCVTKFAPQKALELIASCKLTFDESVVLHRMVDETGRVPAPKLTDLYCKPSTSTSG